METIRSCKPLPIKDVIDFMGVFMARLLERAFKIQKNSPIIFFSVLSHLVKIRMVLGGKLARLASNCFPMVSI